MYYQLYHTLSMSRHIRNLKFHLVFREKEGLRWNGWNYQQHIFRLALCHKGSFSCCHLGVLGSGLDSSLA